MRRQFSLHFGNFKNSNFVFKFNSILGKFLAKESIKEKLSKISLHDVNNKKCKLFLSIFSTFHLCILPLFGYCHTVKRLGPPPPAPPLLSHSVEKMKKM